MIESDCWKWCINKHELWRKQWESHSTSNPPLYIGRASQPNASYEISFFLNPRLYPRMPHTTSIFVNYQLILSSIDIFGCWSISCDFDLVTTTDGKQKLSQECRKYDGVVRGETLCEWMGASGRRQEDGERMSLLTTDNKMPSRVSDPAWDIVVELRNARCHGYNTVRGTIEGKQLPA